MIADRFLPGKLVRVWSWDTSPPGPVLALVLSMKRSPESAEKVLVLDEGGRLIELSVSMGYHYLPPV